MGVRDLRAVNLALLCKWRWRLISGGVGLSRDVILARYNSLSPSPHIGGRLGGLRRASCWWRNVSLLGDPEDAISDWFSEGVTKKDRLPTRQNLLQRGVIGDASASTCVLCGLGSESVDHLFIFCNQISPVWYGILRWLGVELVPPRGVLEFFEAFLGIGIGIFSVECLVDKVKLLSWKWFLGKNSGSPCSFYEWGIHHTLCWNR
ncbi:hypothetical protein TSUD_355200 [Trifolium subterraneum]|uniref:Reverse transcriptase zinc-binding domain-containing protein n=1 Tax=Trifolium subterraneum TaxID=3900 RepID=A0A2Z6MDP1_TRISU|nr:hypothetical protein TSUD_355200 [Trifolium subterraneum]